MRPSRKHTPIFVAISSAAHLMIAGAIVGVSLERCFPEPEKISSDALDIDLVAPRLAPPKRGIEGSEAPSGLDVSRAVRPAAQGLPRAAVAQIVQPSPIQRRIQLTEAPRQQRPEKRRRRRAERAKLQVWPTAELHEPNPLALLAAVREARAAEAQRAAGRAASPQQRGRPSQRARISRHRLGNQGSGGPGMRFFLSGRSSPTSRVVRPPELVGLPSAVCRSSSPAITPTTVRLLVAVDGSVNVPYVKNSSGERVFDRCALRLVRAMRFRPGTDAAGNPLNVWIHIRVEPSIAL
ncbi:MAG: energy transducer TonB [Deltaproteobacteria bacterium]|nr:energy transducer TonB [Deltaproteobacteria bacterium]